jgi:hypothetical protein
MPKVKNSTHFWLLSPELQDSKDIYLTGHYVIHKNLNLDAIFSMP